VSKRFEPNARDWQDQRADGGEVKLIMNKNFKLINFILVLFIFFLPIKVFAQQESHWQFNPTYKLLGENGAVTYGASVESLCATVAPRKWTDAWGMRWDSWAAMWGGACYLWLDQNEGNPKHKLYVPGNQWYYVPISSECKADPDPKTNPTAVAAIYDSVAARQNKNSCSYYCPAGSTKVGNVWCQPQPCPVQPLTTLTGDALAFENGNNVREDGLSPTMAGALNNLRTAVRRAGGTLTVTSAWRPPEYQGHLREILDKRNTLNEPDHMRTYPQCASLRSVVNAESGRHGIGTEVGLRSRHTAGNAFDATWSGITEATLDRLAGEAGLSRPIANDPVHFQAR
jgi:hypothetical protein